ncbi:3-isopropylmalate dehydratase small subunit [Caulifigura coniformis]|uniref:3-isopropylmalate dehydratase n=1 Tax=Caulifigura coniformis TaxID=2527983 RepID=A0A517SBM5_9PLAN|nr:3-isopropylmalate dehydratase small subunit [Caulifigura coniformis]QDT53523.1 3-isopropylmalate dehydratase small subunit [Caulifigura coniformis]
MQKIDSIRGRAIPLVLDDIDTDRIIPARYLRCVTFDGLGQYAFEDDRKQDPQHPFNDARFQGASILIAGRNFGCGSSREHAPQSLMRWGIKAIVAESYAEIFFGNCNSLGIPAVRASRENLEKLAAAIRAEPTTDCVLDLNSLTLKCGTLTVPVEMPAAVKDSLVTGQWDFLGQLLDRAADVDKTAKEIPYMQFAK